MQTPEVWNCTAGSMVAASNNDFITRSRLTRSGVPGSPASS